MRKTLITFMMTLLFIASANAQAEETKMEKLNASTEKSKNEVKKGYRHMEEKACPMVNGKINCAFKKVGHGVQNAANATSAKTKELKNKVD